MRVLNINVITPVLFLNTHNIKFLFVTVARKSYIFVYIVFYNIIEERILILENNIKTKKKNKQTRTYD